MFLFFLLAFIGFASPVALYVINKKEKDLKNKSLLNTVFGIKLIIDLFFYSAFIFAINPFSILFFIILNGLVYLVYDQKKNPNSYLPLEEQEKQLELEKNLLADKFISIMKSEFIDTGRIFTFQYEGQNDLEPHERNVIVKRAYKKYGFAYIDALDLDINEERTFRADRISFQ